MTKDVFVSVIEAVRSQVEHDKNYAFGLSKFFGFEDVAMYDNSLLIGNIFALIQTHFFSADVIDELQHYCFDTNFGKPGPEAEETAPAEFWDLLQAKEERIKFLEYGESEELEIWKAWKKHKEHEPRPSIH